MSDYNDEEYRRDRESRDRRRVDRSDRDHYRRDDRGDRDRSYDRYDDRHSDRSNDRGQYDDFGDDGYRRSPRREDDSRYGGYRRDDQGRDDRASQKWMADTPSHTILLRGLPPSIDEMTLRTELQSMSVLPKDVRLVKRKDTGQSRGFAFVEFHSVLEAQTWMENVRGHITLLDKYTIQMYYSSPKSGGGGGLDTRMQDWTKTDWTCLKCGTHNFKRRDHCFKCNMSREDSETVKDGDGQEHVGHNPCNTLIFRGLDALTTEDSILTGLMRVTALPTKNVKVMKDTLTNTSKGYAFVEMPSLQESQQLLDTIHNLLFPFDIDGKAVVVSYAKNTYSTIMAVSLQPQWGQSSDPSSQYYHQSQQAADTGSYNYATFYSQQQAAVAPQSDTANAAAALALAAIQQANAAKHYKQDGRPITQASPAVVASPAITTTVTSPPVSVDGGKYPVPDVSTYTYDATSGYYYDASTGFYYEANTQYYYNPQTQQFLYWDGMQQTYLPAPTQGTSTGTTGQQQAGADNKDTKEKEKKQKGQVAKKIAKDMEKWAKSQNAQKEMMKKVITQTTATAVPAATSAAMVTATVPGGVAMVRESATADAGFAVLEKKSDRNNLQRMAESGGALVSYGSDSEGEAGDDDEPTTVQAIEERLTDWTKLACLLCKRQFPARETLQKHQQMSDLHKNNLNDYVKAKRINLLPASGTPTNQQPLLYRDRAKERRQKYGAPPPPQLMGGGKKVSAAPPARQQQRGDDDYYDMPPVIAEKPATPALDNSNIGNKLMQKMGWNQGQGLGRENQGMSAPIEAKPRQSLSGLGADGANTYYVRQPGESYVSAVKNTMYARFKEMD